MEYMSAGTKSGNARGRGGRGRKSGAASKVDTSIAEQSMVMLDDTKPEVVPPDGIKVSDVVRVEAIIGGIVEDRVAESRAPEGGDRVPEGVDRVEESKETVVERAGSPPLPEEPKSDDEKLSPLSSSPSGSPPPSRSPMATSPSPVRDEASPPPPPRDPTPPREEIKAPTPRDPEPPRRRSTRRDAIKDSVVKEAPKPVKRVKKEVLKQPTPPPEQPTPKMDPTPPRDPTPLPRDPTPPPRDPTPPREISPPPVPPPEERPVLRSALRKPTVSVPRRDPNEMPPTRRRNYSRKSKDAESDAKSTPRRVLNLRVAGYTRKRIKEIDGSYKESPGKERVSVLRFQSPVESQARPSVPRVESTQPTPKASVQSTPKESPLPSSTQQTPRASEPPTPKSSAPPTPKRSVEKHGNVEIEVTTERERKDSVGSQLFGSDDEGRGRDRSMSRSPSPRRRERSRSPMERSRSPRRRNRSPVERSRSPTPRRRNRSVSPRERSRSPRGRGRGRGGEDTEDDMSYTEESTYYEPTEEELQDEYRALIKRLSRMYRYLDIEIPPAGTPSRRLKRLYRYYVDEVSVSQGLEKYKIGLTVGFLILEALGKKMGLPCDGYADLQQEQISNYHDMLIEFGDRGYFGFAKNWPVEARLFGMMMLNMGVLIGARLLLEPGNAAKLVKALVGNRATPGIQIDANAPAASPDGNAGGGAAPAAGGLGGLGGLLGGGGGGLASILSTVMGALGGGGAPARERSDQAAPSYRSRRHRA